MMKFRVALLLAMLCAPLFARADQCPNVAFSGVAESARVLTFGLVSAASGGMSPITGVSESTSNLRIVLGSNAGSAVLYTNGGSPDIDNPADPIVYVDPNGDVGFDEIGHGRYTLHPDPDWFATAGATELWFEVYENTSTPTFLSVSCSINVDVVTLEDGAGDIADATVAAMDSTSTQLSTIAASTTEPVDANVVQINGVTINGTGVDGDEFEP
jgi:hypothetical protein